MFAPGVFFIASDGPKAHYGLLGVQAVSIANREVGSGPEFENATCGIVQRILSRAPGRMKDQAYRETGGALLKIPLC